MGIIGLDKSKYREYTYSIMNNSLRKQIMVRMREAGYTLEEIAETFNVTKQRIGIVLEGIRFNKPAISAIIPEKVETNR